MTAYWELLRDPRWQKKRLEVMERENFECQECGAKDKTLNVHHGYYAKGRKPWEYEDESLRCLCEPCHQRVTELLADAHRTLGLLSVGDIEYALASIRATAGLFAPMDEQKRFGAEEKIRAREAAHEAGHGAEYDRLLIEEKVAQWHLVATQDDAEKNRWLARKYELGGQRCELIPSDVTIWD